MPSAVVLKRAQRQMLRKQHRSTWQLFPALRPATEACMLECIEFVIVQTDVDIDDGRSSCRDTCLCNG